MSYASHFALGYTCASALESQDIPFIIPFSCLPANSSMVWKSSVSPELLYFSAFFPSSGVKFFSGSVSAAMHGVLTF